MTTVTLVSWILGIFLSLMVLLFIITLSTEPFLIPLRKLVPPIGGVDITPVLWIGIFSLMREILLGQQGLLTILLQ